MILSEYYSFFLFIFKIAPPWDVFYSHADEHCNLKEKTDFSGAKDDPKWDVTSILLQLSLRKLLFTENCGHTSETHGDTIKR